MQQPKKNLGKDGANCVGQQKCINTLSCYSCLFEYLGSTNVQNYLK